MPVVLVAVPPHPLASRPLVRSMPTSYTSKGPASDNPGYVGLHTATHMHSPGPRWGGGRERGGVQGGTWNVQFMGHTRIDGALDPYKFVGATSSLIFS